MGECVNPCFLLQLGIEGRMSKKTALPDVQIETQDRHQVPLAWVGMDKIPLQVQIPFAGQDLLVFAEGRAQVSLDKKEARGIHMSRLYETLERDLFLKPISLAGLAEVTRSFLESHEGLSLRARVRVQFVVPISRETLKSGRMTHREFPIELIVTSSTVASAGTSGTADTTAKPSTATHATGCRTWPAWPRCRSWASGKLPT